MANEDPQLSAGICARLTDYNGPPDDPVLTETHTVQVLTVKSVGSAGQGANDRFRMILSDGQTILQAMLATQLNHLLNDHSIQKNTVIRIKRMSANMVQGKTLMIVLQVEPVVQLDHRIGNPATDKAQRTDSTTSVPVQSSSNTPAPASSTNTTPSLPRSNPPQAKNGTNVLPIEALSPYQNNWTIKARVLQKSEIKTWSNQRGEGKLFNVTLMDETGEIRATAFNQQVDQFEPILQEGKVYLVTKARVNLAKKKFSNLANDYELSLDRQTEITECAEAAGVPSIKYSFVSFNELDGVSPGSIIDVIGIVQQTGDVGEITIKATSRQLTKRELRLVDKSGFTVPMTLWGKQAESWAPDEPSPVVAFKGIKVSDFGGRSLSMVGTSIMSLSPDIGEAYELRGWYDSEGTGQSFQAHSRAADGPGSGGGGSFNRAELTHLQAVKEMAIDETDKGTYFSTRATIMHIKQENLAYPACNSKKGNCQKKAIEVGDSWRCEKCDENFEKPKYRYMISMAVSDWSGQAWLQGFNDVGTTVFGMDADALMHIKDECAQDDKDGRYNLIMHKANCQTFNFQCRAKQDTYNENTRVRYGIQKILPLDYKEECKYLLSLLDSPWAK